MIVLFTFRAEEEEGPFGYRKPACRLLWQQSADNICWSSETFSFDTASGRWLLLTADN